MVLASGLIVSTLPKVVLSVLWFKILVIDYSTYCLKMDTYILTSQDFSWLQKGQLNCWSRGSMALRFGGGFRFDLRRPMSSFIYTKLEFVYVFLAKVTGLTVLLFNIVSVQTTFHILSGSGKCC